MPEQTKEDLLRELQLEELTERCLWSARNLVQERNDLQARIDKINLRLVGLGFREAAGFGEKKDDEG